MTVSLHDINMRKAFRSSRSCEQQVVSRATMPLATRQLYSQCEPPPPLNRLNRFRTDGKDGLKFYTDPSYFFELWRAEMLRETPGAGKHDKSRKVIITRFCVAPSDITESTFA